MNSALRERGQVTLNLTPTQLERIDAIVTEQQSVDPFVRRADVIRSIVECGLRQMVGYRAKEGGK